MIGHINLCFIGRKEIGACRLVNLCSNYLECEKVTYDNHKEAGLFAYVICCCTSEECMGYITQYRSRKFGKKSCKIPAPGFEPRIFRSLVKHSIHSAIEAPWYTRLIFKYINQHPKQQLVSLLT